MFEVGDFVRITDTGYSYSAYSDWGDKYLENFSRMTPPKGAICEIIAKALHSVKDKNILYGLRDQDSYEYIMGMRGLKLVKKRNYAEDFFGDLFEI